MQSQCSDGQDESGWFCGHCNRRTSLLSILLAEGKRVNTRGLAFESD